MNAAPIPYLIRLANASDAAIIARQRSLIFREMGGISENEVESIFLASTAWLQDLLAKKEYVGWVILHQQEEVIGGGGILLRQVGPAPGCHRVGRWGHIANVYIHAEHRRRGLASLLMQEIVQWTRSNHLDHVTLTASSEGRPLYESLGFIPGAEMKLPHAKDESLPTVS